MRETQEKCPYCKGEGYFHLLLGGTESCPGCEGTGAHAQEAVLASRK
ncbi:YuiA family protein [Brevibacillus panacihumi]|nr:YuiA family protein [Brevibacillus panacihumi]